VSVIPSNSNKFTNFSPFSFPIDQDFYVSPTFQDILNRTISKTQLPWYKTLRSYYNRPEWEFFDLKLDGGELINMANKKEYAKAFNDMKKRLWDWQVETNDPWRCSPHAVLQDKGEYKGDPHCLTLAHDEM
jgi:N-sulfoglucosamine sulfohydrolase